MTASKEKKWLQAELDMTEHSSQTEEKFSQVEEELQAKQKKVTFLTEQFEQQKRILEMLKQKGKAK